MNLRVRLSIALAAVIVLALLLAGAAFVVLNRDDREQQALDHLAAVAPQVTLELRAVQRAGATPEQVAELIRQAAREEQVRVLLVDRRNVVTEDSEGNLEGRTLEPPPPGSERSLYRTWTGRGADGERLVFLYVPQPQFVRLPRATGEPLDRIVLAVPEATVARAWRDLLPGLLWAGALALVISLVVAALLARSIARPLAALTRASEEMARGQFDHDIPVRRDDEVGRLAKAFNLMAREVGRSHIQMRALIANVSHDLKTPLTSILGFSQALRDRDVEGADATAETGAIIHEEAERVQSLVDDLLFLSEIESGQVPLLQDPVDLSVLTARSVRRFAPRFEEKGIAVTVDAPDALTVRGDAAKLERILDNLLDNAAKYAPNGAAVTVRATGGDAVTVAVHNSGSHIPAEELPRIFERFYRRDRARSGAPRGSGLGLAIARELAELHGGTLTAASDAEGTTFRLRLPAARHELHFRRPERGAAASPAQQPG
jgi:signal transduction histidine kinase